MVQPSTRYSQTRKRLNPWVIALIALIHVALFYLLARALAPTAVAGVERTVVSAFSVTVTTPEEELEPTAPEPEGAQGEPGREAVPAPVTAPEPERRLREDPPAPRASSTGSGTRLRRVWSCQRRSPFGHSLTRRCPRRSSSGPGRW